MTDVGVRRTRLLTAETSGRAGRASDEASKKFCSLGLPKRALRDVLLQPADI
jgi:hypothetical protein